MRARSVRSGGKPRGAAVVEFALVVPALLLVLLGTIDWGYYFFVREATVNAAREGARAGTLVQPGGDPLPDARTAATSYVVQSSLDPGRMTVSATTGARSVIVEVRYRVGSITGFLGGVLPAEVVARAEMRR
jgi:Flp pilus assembly protein TadG